MEASVQADLEAEFIAVVPKIGRFTKMLMDGDNEATRATVQTIVVNFHTEDSQCLCHEIEADDDSPIAAAVIEREATTATRM